MNWSKVLLVFGMTANTRIIDMTTVQKYPLRRLGYGCKSQKIGRLSKQTYTGPVSGEKSNYIHKVSSFRAGNDDDIIQHKRDKSTSISNIVDVGTNG